MKGLLIKMQWLINNLGTLVVLLIVAVIIGLAVFSVVRKRAKGGCSCGCGCNNCPMSGKCHASSLDFEDMEK